MKLCIIGPEKRSDSEIELMETAKKKFDSVLYAPIEMIRIETCKDKAVPFLKNTNLLEFDAILPRVTKKNADFLGLQYEEIQGSLNFFKKFLSGNWDSDFIVTGKDQELTQDFYNARLYEPYKKNES